MNTHTNRGTMGTQADLITAIVQRIFRNPSLGPVFTSLYHGDYMPVDEAEVDGILIVDTYVISFLRFSHLVSLIATQLPLRLPSHIA